MAGFSSIETPSDLIRTAACPNCPVCGSQGVALYPDQTDRFFGAAGRWNCSRCPQMRCGTLWLNPMPLESDIWKAYRQYYTHGDGAAGAAARKYNARLQSVSRRILQDIKRAYIASRLRYSVRPAGWRDSALGALAYLDPTRRADTDFPLGYLPVETRGRLLDLGCGSGDLLATMCRYGWQAEGLDIDPQAVNVARRRGLRARPGSIYDQRFPDTSFDAVVMAHVIEHVHHPRELLAEVRRILKPGRPLVIATPNARSLGHRILGARWPFLDPPRHLQVFTAGGLEAIVQAAGFSGLRLRSTVRTAAAMFPRMGGSHLVGRFFEYAESFALHLDRDAGEELQLVATR